MKVRIIQSYKYGYHIEYKKFLFWNKLCYNTDRFNGFNREWIVKTFGTLKEAEDYVKNGINLNEIESPKVVKEFSI
jgi:hypothetical protein